MSKIYDKEYGLPSQYLLNKKKRPAEMNGKANSCVIMLERISRIFQKEASSVDIKTHIFAKLKYRRKKGIVFTN